LTLRRAVTGHALRAVGAQEVAARDELGPEASPNQQQQEARARDPHCHDCTSGTGPRVKGRGRSS
jgi:hypothetical protein